MGKHTEMPNINFINQPDIGYVWEVLLNLLSAQNGWNRDFSVTATRKELRENQHLGEDSVV